MSQHTYPIQTIKLRQATEKNDFRKALEASLAGPTGKTTLKDAVAPLLGYGPQVALFCIRRAGLDPKRREPLGSDCNGGDCDVLDLLQQIWAFEKWIDTCEDTPAAGCITVDDQGQYHDFQPLVDGVPITEPGAGMTRLDFATFDDAVREFFSKIQCNRAASQITQQENAAQKKLEAIRRDHALRIENLNKEVGVAERKANVLQYNLSEADAVMAMFHDQGLPVLKYSGFGDAVNITLGLPFIRTSVDHGTALDLAGTGEANLSSFLAAVSAANTMVEQSRATA